MEITEDMRIRKSKKELRNAIMEIIKHKSIEKISVTEICDAALITRMTFYKYYNDKYELLDDVFTDFKDNLLASVPKRDVNSIEEALDYTCDLIKLLINFIQNNFDIIQAIKRNSNNAMMEIITNIAEDSISELLKKANEIKPLRYPIPMTSAFIFGGFIATLNYWLEHPTDSNFKKVKLLVDDVRNNVLCHDFLFK